MNRIVRIFLDVDFRNQHDGLAKLARENNVSVGSLKDGEHIIFINTARNKIKMYSNRDVLSYMRLPSGRKVDLEALVEMTKCFKGDIKVSYKTALTKKVKDKLRLNSHINTHH